MKPLTHEKTLDEIINVVGSVMNLQPELIRQKNAKFPIPDARHLFCWVSNKCYGYQKVDIAKYLDCRNHSTIVSSVKKIEQWKDVYIGTNNRIINITKELGWNVRDVTQRKQGE